MPRTPRATAALFPSRSPRALRTAATRQDLVHAGRRLFSTEGLYESRIEDITGHAGIAKGTLYLHFRSKEALVVAVVSDGFEGLRQRLAESLTGTQDVAALAAEVLATHLDFFARNPDLMRIFHQVRGALAFDRPRWRPLGACLRQHLEFLADRLAVGEARAWPAVRRRGLAIFLFGCASGTCSVLATAWPEEWPRAGAATWNDVPGRVAAAAVLGTFRGSGVARTRRPGSRRARS